MKIVLTPDWFLGFDVLIELFSFIVLVVFSVLAIQSYRLDKKKKNLLYLGLGFGLVALAQLATILTKTVLYTNINVIEQIGQIIITSHLVRSVDIFYYIGFFFYRFLTLAGLYMIYRLPYHKSSVQDYILVAYFILLSAIISEEVTFLFHLTALIILMLVLTNYYNIYQETKFPNTRILLIAFGILAFSQFVFIFSEGGILEVTGDIVELVSYIILLTLGIKIKEHGKKKKPDGDNIGYAGNNSGKGRKN